MHLNISPYCFEPMCLSLGVYGGVPLSLEPWGLLLTGETVMMNFLAT